MKKKFLSRLAIEQPANVSKTSHLRGIQYSRFDARAKSLCQSSCASALGLCLSTIRQPESQNLRNRQMKRGQYALPALCKSGIGV
jgi:hypothetical protein